MRGAIKRTGIILSVIFNIAFIGGYCYNNILWKGKEKGSFIKSRVKKIEKELQLSDEQRRKIELSTEAAIREASRIRTQINIHRLEMIKLLALPQPDRDAIESKRQEIALLQQEIHKLILEKILEDKEILTPEQQRKLFLYLREKIKRRLGGSE